MKKKLSLLLAFVLCLGLMPCAYADNNPFNDVAPGFWAYDDIMETYNDGVMTGTASGVFSPSGKLNMAQFVTVLTRAFYNNDVVNSTREGAWPNQNYNAAEKHNLFAGLTRWGGDIEVTREVMAQMMYNVMVDKSVVLPNDTEIQATINKIPDIAAVDDNYRTAVAVCYYWELLAGVDAQGTFAPKGVLNRAQTAVIYTRLKKAVNVLGAGIPENPGTATPDTTAPGTADNPGDTQNPQAAPSATLTNGMPVTEENVLALIEEYRNGKEPGEKAKEAGFTSYTDYSEYDPYNPKYLGALGTYGTECAKFAFAFWDDIFGDASYREVTDPWEVRPGDLIHWDGHWAIAVKGAYSRPSYSFPFTQTVDGGKAGSIGWGTVDSRLDYNNVVPLIAVYTRYPLPYETE
ncbi:MAG: hypothetical protein HFF72_00805 [Oscillospiraceae bacterium]|jgi:hypothetical protein|nr:hypothetical protein [Oscillospiraceae bacterium]